MPPIQLPSPSSLINCSDLSSCLQNLYNLGVAVLIALCFLYFVFGAFQYLLSGANIFSTEKAKNKMKNSIIALIVVFVIPVVLYYINPRIFNLEFKIPEVIVFPPMFLGADAETHPPGAPSTTPNDNDSDCGCDKTCGDEGPLEEINTDGKEIVFISEYSSLKLHKDTANALKDAIEIARSNYASSLPFTITSAYRSCKDQCRLWTSRNKDSRWAARPSCKAPHMRGRAVDIFRNNSECEPNNPGKRDVIMDEIMKQAGFKIYKAECWHYEK